MRLNLRHNIISKKIINLCTSIILSLSNHLMGIPKDEVLHNFITYIYDFTSAVPFILQSEIIIEWSHRI